MVAFLTALGGWFRSFIFPPAGQRASLLRRPQWEEMDGVRNILVVAVPLIASAAVHSINMFLDRIFLAWHSADEFAAALQAGTLFWAFCVLFFATVTYGSTMGAQYLGARRPRQLGPVTWQAVYVGIFGGVILAATGWMTWPFFQWVGHEGNLPLLEYQYFSTLTLGGWTIFINVALSGFFAAQGRTWLVLFVNACSCLLNFCLNAWMIFQPVWIFPDGIRGAAWASIIATFFGAVLFVLFILADRRNEAEFAMLSGWRFCRSQTRKLLRFGFPTGVQGLIDMAGFTTFAFVLGLFGKDAHLASNMALNLNLLLFIPAVGAGQAISLLVGQACGARHHVAAERITFTSGLLIAAYLTLVCWFYVGQPELLLNPFRGGMPQELWEQVLPLAKLLLVFTVIYTFGDIALIVYSSALRGAGDTKFVMKVSMVCSIAVFAVPNVVLGAFADQLNPRTGLLISWAIFSSFLILLGVINLLRYRSGHWKDIEMVEDEPVVTQDDLNRPQGCSDRAPQAA